MPRLLITKEAHAALRSAALYEFKETAIEVDGMMAVPLEDETIDRLVEIMFPGESISDTIIRLVSGRQ